MAEVSSPGDSTALLMPLGFPLGLNLEPAGAAVTGSIQTSAGVLAMDPDSYFAWSLARRVTSRVDLVSLLKRQGIVDPASCVADLEAAGLLVEMLASRIAATSFYESVRLIPTGLAIGRRRAQDRYLEVRTLTREICQLRPLSFAVWALSAQGASISVCLHQCAVELESQQGDALVGFLEDLIQMVARRGAFLDHA